MRPSCLGVDASSQAAKPRVRCTAVRGRASAQNTYMPIYAQLASAINLRFPRINCSLHPVGSVKARMKSRQIEAPPRWRLSQSVETRLPHTVHAPPCKRSVHYSPLPEHNSRTPKLHAAKANALSPKASGSSRGGHRVPPEVGMGYLARWALGTSRANFRFSRRRENKLKTEEPQRSLSTPKEAINLL